MATQPQFKVGDRCFTHYDMKWGTVRSVDETRRGDTHGVTGSKLPDTTWYTVAYDGGGVGNLDDAHGNWDMARMLPPHIAKRYGYGEDPNPPQTTPPQSIPLHPTLEPVNALTKLKRIA